MPLESVLAIPAAFISRVSNSRVFEKAGVAALSKQVLYRQLLLLGKVARSDAGTPLRADTFVGNSLNPQMGRFIRRVGRPWLDWTSEVLKAGAQKLGSHSRMVVFLADRGEQTAINWRRELDRVFAR